eukprot:CCRYP_011806-RE/>CCRYP_011806-RE protein AED:0.30 eAED:0.30 QI:0/-1/0/1/-1/0/1/0/232
MYTNIKTPPALKEISSLLQKLFNDGTFRHYNPKSLIEALHLVFENNFFKLGDTYWRQKSGTGMGISPAPPWATIFYGIFEEHILKKWKQYLFLFKRFIDDIFGIWLSDPSPEVNEAKWEEFTQDLNCWYGLTWPCTAPALSCDFMDMTISIENGTLVTRVFKKDMNLYLYLPPTSSHPKGIGTGLIFGQVLRYRRLSTHQCDADKKIREFYQRLLARGHSPNTLSPLFLKAE